MQRHMITQSDVPIEGPVQKSDHTTWCPSSSALQEILSRCLLPFLARQPSDFCVPTLRIYFILYYTQSSEGYGLHGIRSTTSTAREQGQRFGREGFVRCRQ